MLRITKFAFEAMFPKLLITLLTGTIGICVGKPPDVDIDKQALSFNGRVICYIMKSVLLCGMVPSENFTYLQIMLLILVQYSATEKSHGFKLDDRSSINRISSVI